MKKALGKRGILCIVVVHIDGALELLEQAHPLKLHHTVRFQLVQDQIELFMDNLF